VRAEGGRFVQWRIDYAAPAVIEENESWLVVLRAPRAPIQRSAAHPGMAAIDEVLTQVAAEGEHGAMR
jgi:hypothetical protein